MRAGRFTRSKYLGDECSVQSIYVLGSPDLDLGFSGRITMGAGTVGFGILYVKDDESDR